VRFAVDLLHPAHVHFFRCFVAAMRERGHEVLITARDKECTFDLLAAYGLPYTAISRQAAGAPALARELAVRTARFWRLARRFRPDYLLGIMGPTIALAGKALPSRTVIFYDTEMARATNRFAYPLADVVCTPECYQGRVPTRHVRYPGYHELAYLHPARFRPDPALLAEHGLGGEEPLYVVRFVAWAASHDAGESGFSPAGKRRLVALLAERGRVVISSEAPLPDDLEPYRLRLPPERVHHLLAAARLLAGESATMASEAAVLGTPAVFVSTTGRGYTDEQERRYGLVHNFTPGQEAEALARVAELADRPDLEADAAERRRRLLAERIDVTAWMVDFFESGAAGRARPEPSDVRDLRLHGG
jgi:predicted glycosyltransferase